MFYVKKFDLSDESLTTLAETEDAARAYEMAHEYDAALHFGRDEDSEPESATPCLVLVHDQNGKNAWAECAQARCPAVGLLQ